ncbi:MAG: hypothetical protein NC341_10385 [Blautia sp.]|nr:hypothetical protein [Blautia sp.]MCM1201614.1 hypothetical protein [Bacteroides fragilis]
MKIRLKVREKNSVIEETLYEESSTGMQRPMYKIKGETDMMDILKISRIVNYVSLSQITTDMYRRNKYTNDTYLDDAESARKRLERHLEKTLRILGVDSYKDDLKIEYRSRMKYQFSEEDIPFLEKLADREIKSQEDLYWAAIGIYSCFCHVKDIDEGLLEDIGNTIQKEIGFTELKHVVAIKNRLGNINSVVDELIQSEKYSKEIKNDVYDIICKIMDDSLQQMKEALQDKKRSR